MKLLVKIVLSRCLCSGDGRGGVGTDRGDKSPTVSRDREHTPPLSGWTQTRKRLSRFSVYHTSNLC